jgi:hypothetical protein
MDFEREARTMRRRLAGWVLMLSGAALALAGCPGPGEEKFIPTEGTARQALETALNAWKGGQAKPGQLAMGKVSVQVVDAVWESGQKLTAYQIVSEDSGNGPPWFTVKLTLPRGEKTVKYVVLGNDPIWVYDEAGYKKLSGS